MLGMFRDPLCSLSGPQEGVLSQNDNHSRGFLSRAAGTGLSRPVVKMMAWRLDYVENWMEKQVRVFFSCKKSLWCSDVVHF